jgi:hypothetical protein
MPISTTRHRLSLALAALGCGVAIAACGGSSKPPSSGSASASSAAGRGIKFSDCMRAHGVANFPDPSTSGAGISIHIGSGSGINPSSPSFKAAQTACGKLLPGGGPGGGGPASAQTKAQMVAVAECMRSHGVSGFPDPTTTPPSSPDGGLVMGHNGVFFAVPRTIDTTSPSFQQAATACKFPGPPGGAQGGVGGAKSS